MRKMLKSTSQSDNKFKETLHNMLLQQIFVLKNLRFLMLLIIAVTELHATTLRDEGEGEKRGEVHANRDVANLRQNTRGGGAPNDYGPAIKITSSVLQLSKATEGSTSVGDIGLAHHETTLEHPWPNFAAAQLPAVHSAWLKLPASQPDFHLIAVPDVSNYHFAQPYDSGAGAGGGSVAGDTPDETAGTLSKGLHTQIISSGKVVTNVSDNLDFGEASEAKAKANYRTSYGR